MGVEESEITGRSRCVCAGCKQVSEGAAADRILFYKSYLCVCNVNFVLQFVESQKPGESMFLSVYLKLEVEPDCTFLAGKGLVVVF